jgi:hypothetical protein
MVYLCDVYRFMLFTEHRSKYQCLITVQVMPLKLAMSGRDHVLGDCAVKLRSLPYRLNI